MIKKSKKFEKSSRRFRENKASYNATKAIAEIADNLYDYGYDGIATDGETYVFLPAQEVIAGTSAFGDEFDYFNKVFKRIAIKYGFTPGINCNIYTKYHGVDLNGIRGEFIYSRYSESENRRVKEATISSEASKEKIKTDKKDTKIDFEDLNGEFYINYYNNKLKGWIALSIAKEDVDVKYHWEDGDYYGPENDCGPLPGGYIGRGYEIDEVDVPKRFIDEFFFDEDDNEISKEDFFELNDYDEDFVNMYINDAKDWLVYKIEEYVNDNSEDFVFEESRRISKNKVARKIKESNRIGNNEFVPDSIDQFLKDVAQFSNLFNYTDIIAFERDVFVPNDKNVKALKKLKTRAKTAAEYDDEEEINQIYQDVADIVIGVVDYEQN